MPAPLCGGPGLTGGGTRVITSQPGCVTTGVSRGREFLAHGLSIYASGKADMCFMLVSCGAGWEKMRALGAIEITAAPNTGSKIFGLVKL